MKLLSVTIPCFNSAAYMRRAIDSLLIGGADVEIIIVDDGSTDETFAIAKEYEEKHPTIVKAVHQQNGGHGEAVNTGLREASGIYFKVVDSDDWVQEKAYLEILSKLTEIVKSGESLDMLISNYVYEKMNEKKKHVVSYRMALPKNCIFTWDNVLHFRKGQYILMHSVIYRTELLKGCGLVLPKHTFYVDNLFVYQPLPFVKTMYYLDVNFYRYFIGRDDQSVNEANMMKRIDQQIFVTKSMLEAHNLFQLKNRKLRTYMQKYLEIMLAICSIYLIKIGDEESLAKKQELWDYLKAYDKRLYKKLSRTFLGVFSKAENKVGQETMKLGYEIARKLFKFN